MVKLNLLLKSRHFEGLNLQQMSSSKGGNGESKSNATENQGPGLSDDPIIW